MSPAARRPRAQRVDIPRCRDPFINSMLTPVCSEPGEPQRFWISTWNEVDGCTGALVDETGAFRLYRFAEPRRGGFYSVVPEDLDTLWLWGDLTEVVRLSLSSGEYECFATGGPHGLVFNGMAYDRASGKLLAAANTYQGAGPTAISFDTHRCETARILEHVALDCYLHGHFANGDGTYTVLTEVPGTSLLRWDPRTDEVQVDRLRDSVDLHSELHEGSYYRLVQDDSGRVYFPRRGWYDPSSRGFGDGPVPEREMTWFARHGDRTVGATSADGDVHVGLWDTQSGAVRQVATIRDSMPLSLNMTESGKLVAVSVYGEFTRRDLLTGRFELSRLLPATGVQHTDCLRLIDRDRLLGTPFITQRFWEINLKTGKGYDCGRAAPGGGEILQTWRLGDRIYMAEYSGGRLVEYDPTAHPHFPENPRVVASPLDANRPIAAAHDGRCLYYACSAPYGRLGSTVTRYDTQTGESITVANPILDQRIVSLAYDAGNHALLATTHFDADCRSCPPTSDRCFLATLQADDLSVTQMIEAPPGTATVHTIGPGARAKWLCRLTGSFQLGGVPVNDILLQVSGRPLELSLLQTAWPIPQGWSTICATACEGRYVVHVGKRVELWDLVESRRVRTVSTRAADRRLIVDGDTVLLLGQRDIVVLRDALAEEDE